MNTCEVAGVAVVAFGVGFLLGQALGVISSEAGAAEKKLWEETRRLRQMYRGLIDARPAGSAESVDRAVRQTLDEVLPVGVVYDLDISRPAPGSVLVRIVLQGREWWKFWRREP